MTKPLGNPWKTRGIFHEFFMANPLGNPWIPPMDLPWKTHGKFHEFSMANPLGESIDWPRNNPWVFHDQAIGESMENSWNIPWFFHGQSIGGMHVVYMSFCPYIISMASPVKIFREFSMAKPLRNPWKTRGIFLQGLPWQFHGKPMEIL